MKRPFGLIIILPKNESDEIEIWNLLAETFKGKFTKIAVYFVNYSEEIMEIYNNSNINQFKFIVKGDDPKPILNLVLEDFYGYLQEVSILILFLIYRFKHQINYLQFY